MREKNKIVNIVGIFLSNPKNLLKIYQYILNVGIKRITKKNRIKFNTIEKKVYD
jgi:hypothetical protein